MPRLPALAAGAPRARGRGPRRSSLRRSIVSSKVAEAGLLPDVEHFVERVVGLAHLGGGAVVVIAQRPQPLAQRGLVDRRGAWAPASLRRSCIIWLRSRWLRRRASCRRFSRMTNWPYWVSLASAASCAWTMA